MKKVGVIILVIVVCLVSITMIDFIYMYNNDKPLFAIENGYKYTGLLYDTYNCKEHSWLVIKPKFSKFACAVELEEKEGYLEDITDNSRTIESIQDETIGRTDLVFAQALEKFYEDETHEYYFSCIKSSYVTVTYTDGTKETVKEALAKGNITMADVDKYGIRYYKEVK